VFWELILPTHGIVGQGGNAWAGGLSLPMNTKGLAPGGWWGWWLWEGLLWVLPRLQPMCEQSLCFAELSSQGEPRSRAERLGKVALLPSTGSCVPKSSSRPLWGLYWDVPHPHASHVRTSPCQDLCGHVPSCALPPLHSNAVGSSQWPPRACPDDRPAAESRP